MTFFLCAVNSIIFAPLFVLKNCTLPSRKPSTVYDPRSSTLIHNGTPSNKVVNLIAPESMSKQINFLSIPHDIICGLSPLNIFIPVTLFVCNKLPFFSEYRNKLSLNGFVFILLGLNEVVEEVEGKDDVEDDLLLTLISSSSSLIIFSILSISTFSVSEDEEGEGEGLEETLA